MEADIDAIPEPDRLLDMKFDSELHTVGMHLVINGQKYRFVISFAAHMGDDKDLYEVGSTNGVGGKKPCPCA